MAAIYPKSKENSAEKRELNVGNVEMNRKEKRRHHESSLKWGYSSPAFHYRSLPTQLYKFKKSLLKHEENSRTHCVVPGMNIQQAILFKKSLNNKFLAGIDKGRKHNNTPVGSSAILAQQMPRRNNLLLHNFKANEQINHRNARERHFAANESLHTIRPAAKCPLCALESEEFKMIFLHARKIDIKLPCLGNQQQEL